MPKKGRIKINLPRKNSHKKKKEQQNILQAYAKQNEIDKSTCVTQDTDDMIVSETDDRIVNGANCYSSDEMDSSSEGLASPGSGFLTSLDAYDFLKQELTIHLTSPYVFLGNSDCITIVELYNSLLPTVKLSIRIDRDFDVELLVHKVEITSDHEFWLELPRVYSNICDVMKLLTKLQSFSICIGNPDEEFRELHMIQQEGLTEKDCSSVAYREGDFGAVKGDVAYSSTIRSSKCKFLVQGARCCHCSSYRSTLIRRNKNLKRRQCQPGIVPKFFNHRYYGKEDLINKIHQQKSKIDSLEEHVIKIKQKFERDITNGGVKLDHASSAAMMDVMKMAQNDLFKVFPDPNCLQRVFWEQQLKNSFPKATTWHPAVIDWCWSLKSKSTAAYDAVQKSGFFKLPTVSSLYHNTPNKSDESVWDADVTVYTSTDSVDLSPEASSSKTAND